jgi:hypothetical protein
MGEHIVIDHTGNEECSVEEFMAAVERATGKPVLESWLFFPVSGGGVKIEMVK